MGGGHTAKPVTKIRKLSHEIRLQAQNKLQVFPQTS